MKKMLDAGSNCPLNPFGEEVPYIRYNTSATNKDLEIFDIDGGNDDGDCILYRYNADGDDFDDPEEQRGYRFNNVTHTIQMGDVTQNFACTDSKTPSTPPKWINLTDPNVIEITALSFSTTGSKCRNMTLPEPNPSPEIIAQYWEVKDKTSPDIQTGLACVNGATLVDYYIEIDDPTNPLIIFTDETVPFTGKTVASIPVDLKDGHQIIGTRQIIITLDATLTRDSSVTKRLESSVKVANPRVHCWPYSGHVACSP